MNIRTKLRALGGITVTGLLIIAAATIWGLNAIRSVEDTAHRRESYVADLLEVKASAAITVMLDPRLPTTKEIFATASQSIEQNGQHAVAAIRRAEVRDALVGILTRWEQYRDASLKLLATAADDPKDANEALLQVYSQQFKPFQAELDGFIAKRREESAKGVEEAQAVSSEVFWIVIGLLAVGIVLTASVIIGVSLSLQSSLQAILRQLAPLSQGDLTQRLPNRGRDELDEVAAGVNAFVAELQSIVQRTRDRSHQLSSASAQLSAAANGVLQTSNQQSDATSSVAASVEEFSVSIDQVADNATQAEEKAQQSGTLSRQGGQDVQKAVAEIQRVAQVVNDATTQMQTLGQQAQDISSIVQVIKDVADQTNLLALNAAIEAARAGEQGRGFAVVADEVRKLAERTTSSAQDITTKVASVQHSTEAASAVMLKGNEFVTDSVRQIEAAGSSMQQISDGSAGVLGAITDISTALREQRIAGAEIARNVERIAQMTDASRSSASDVSSAASQLERLAQDLQTEVARFRV
ncbi:methyl-accepting chemotaxis protein [Zoogloea sp. LCSB751]|uniref:methyl-accepting chemotaxis protein n=1 Tax=Zoogloea sp. LCSB751 TaxID=1965277 RepID=UPI0009A4A5AC|nr:methyl-accepting chemotaxis protein [Zoogloea sp. LCSB751]